MAEAESLDLLSLIKEETWSSKLGTDNVVMEQLAKIEAKLACDYAKRVQVFPPNPLIFEAFNKTPFDKVKVVILGQDPYTTEGQAMGLAFSVPPGVTPPPSLKNIFEELENDDQITNFTTPDHGDLTAWAQRGVFLLNTTLTVGIYDPTKPHSNAKSHEDYGWQKFTNKVIEFISDGCQGVVFILMGRVSQTKADLIDESKHTIIKTAHPSPLSITDFENCKCFSMADAALVKYGRDKMDWSL